METGILWLMGKSLAALAAVLALFAGMVWLMRRLQGISPVHHEKTARLKIQQRLALDTRNSLIEIEYGGQNHLIAMGPNGITSIAHRPVTPEESVQLGEEEP